MALDKNARNEQMQNNDRELYSEIATLYSTFRPQYPTEMIDRAIALGNLCPGSDVLEIGCGPGTATRPFLDRGLHLTCVEPSSGMLAEAKLLCGEFKHVTFRQNTFQEFRGPSRLMHSVMAASSFHWVVDANAVKKIHSMMHDESALILLWNLPLEPPLPVREAVARNTGRNSPFFFGGFSVSEHRDNIRTKVLDVVESSGLFGQFSHEEHAIETCLSTSEYVNFLSTLSPFIRMPGLEREKFFCEVKQTLNSFGEHLNCSSTCILNVAKKR